MNNDKSNNNGDDKLIKGHEYDGIQELDNPLPGWWLATFYGTIIFAIGYYIAYTFMGAPSLKDELKTAMDQINSNKPVASKSLNEDELSAKINPQSVEAGKALFATRCASCHGEKGQGLIGPNLTDNFWIHGKGTRADIYKVVMEGVLDKGMPTWGELLKPEEIIAVVGFVYSLKNTNVPGGKPPQGEEVKD